MMNLTKTCKFCSPKYQAVERIVTFEYICECFLFPVCWLAVLNVIIISKLLYVENVSSLLDSINTVGFGRGNKQN
jgi:predicted ABC-type sugar transport system permease subunit